ncbi:hypothetical protein [Frankia sp. Cas4]|uniref:hypothetical protein n=1 Tax=Frankia sp. Cas4 TaxID=3073927 RepID=UPI002AD33E96|nr:hypothetical protein [Frankia sp. Cas4]
MIRDNLDIGRPDQVNLIFDRQLRHGGQRPTPSRLRTRIITEGVTLGLHVDYTHATIKQYHKEGKALRTETTINDTRSYSAGEVVRVTQHLARPGLDPFAANDVMLQRIGQAIENGQPLSAGQANFMRHEWTEADPLDQGMPYEQAHDQALTVHPPGRNYDPDVIDQFPEFGPWWRNMNGLGPR